MRRWMPWIMVVGLVLVGGLMLARWVGAQRLFEPLQAKTGLSEGVSTPMPSNLVAKEKLFDPALDPQSRAGITEKLNMQQKAAADQGTGKANPASKEGRPVLPSVGGQPAILQVESGIFPGSDGMVRPEEAQINNYWQGNVAGSQMVVLAGSEVDDKAKGLVIVLSSDGFSMTGYQRVSAPDGFSSLHVVEQQETRLVLLDSQQHSLVFDLKTLAFAP
jgi:hypothetical protein